MTTVDDFQRDGLHEDIRAFQIDLARKFPDYRVTSGLRPGATTKQGRPSRHATGEALDIGFRKDIRDYLWNTPEGLSLLDKHGLGLIDESTPEMLKKTGGTGAHLHIGKDSSYVNQAKQRYQQMTGSNTPLSDTYVTPYMNTQTITNSISDLPKKEESSTFTEEDKTAQEEPKKEDFDKAQMQQELNEYNLKQEIQQRFTNALQGQQPLIQQEEQAQEMPTKTVGQIYGEASNIVGVPMQQGGIIETLLGQYQYPGEVTKIPSNRITMKGMEYPILAQADSGEMRMMYPNEEHIFEGAKSVTEYPQLNEYFKNKYNK